MNETMALFLQDDDDYFNVEDEFSEDYYINQNNIDVISRYIKNFDYVNDEETDYESLFDNDYD